MPSNHLIICHPLLLLPSVFPSIRVFSNELALPIRWPKYWGFSFSIKPSNEYSGLISIRVDWLDLLGVQGTLKSLLQHHNLKATILWRSAFFIVQLSHPYMTIGKTIAFTIWTFIRKVMSLLFNMLCRFVIAFLLRSKSLLISWMQSPSTVILGPKKIKSATVFTFPPSICHEVMGLDATILAFECWVLSQLFRSPFSPSSRGSLVPLHFLPSEWYHLHIWGCWYFSRQSWFQLVLPAARPFAWCALHRRQIRYHLSYQGDPQGEGSEKVMNSGRCPPTVTPFTPQKSLVRLRVLADCRTFSGWSTSKCIAGASPVAPWEGIRLPGLETRFRFLTQEDPNATEDSARVTTAGWACALWATSLDARSPRVLGPGLRGRGSGRSENPAHRNWRKARSNKEDPTQPKRNSVKPEVWPRSEWVPRSFIQETGPFQDEMKSPLFGDLFWDSPPPQFVNCILHLRLGIRRQVCCDVKGTLFV